jgi:hypothetical protein
MAVYASAPTEPGGEPLAAPPRPQASPFSDGAQPAADSRGPGTSPGEAGGLLEQLRAFAADSDEEGPEGAEGSFVGRGLSAASLKPVFQVCLPYCLKRPRSRP